MELFVPVCRILQIIHVVHCDLLAGADLGPGHQTCNRTMDRMHHCVKVSIVCLENMICFVAQCCTELLVRSKYCQALGLVPRQVHL